MKRAVYWIGPLLCMGIIFLLSSQPYDQQNIQPLIRKVVNIAWVEDVLQGIGIPYRGRIVSISSHGGAGFIEFLIRKGAHITVFMLLFLLTFWALRRSFPHHSVAAHLVASVVLAILYAGLDEYHQTITPNRTPSVTDVFIDMFGIGLGVMVVLIRRGWIGLRKRVFRD